MRLSSINRRDQMSCVEHLRKALKDRRQRIIIACEPEDVELVEKAIDSIDCTHCQGTVEVTYEPPIKVGKVYAHYTNDFVVPDNMTEE